MYILFLSLSGLDRGNVCRVEATLWRWNNLLQLLIHLAGTCSGAGEVLKRFALARSGHLDASDLVWFSSALFFIVVGAAVSDGLGEYLCQLKEKTGLDFVYHLF